MTPKEMVALNFFPSDTEVPPLSIEHEKIKLLRSIYITLTKYIASKGFAIFPHRPGIRFFADSDQIIDIAGMEHHLVRVENWAGKISEIRFHDGFVTQIEFIDGKIWLKIDPRQLVLIKGNEQTKRDYYRSFYTSYCLFSDCDNRPHCLVARPKTFRVQDFSYDKETAIQLKELLGYGCKFYTTLKGNGDIIKAEWRREEIMFPWRMVYFKGAITDMPDYSLRKLYQNRCLLKSKERLALTQFAFSVLSDNTNSFSVLDEVVGEITFQNMFEGEVEFWKSED